MRTAHWYALLAVLCLLPAKAALGDAGARLVVMDGSGMVGDTVTVVILLADDFANEAVSADLDIDFPPALVAISSPVSVSCHIDPRLETTHQVGGRVPRPGLLRFALFPRAPEIHSLGNGLLASCDFRIVAGATGASAPLTIEYAGLGDAMGDLLPVGVDEGLIALVDSSTLPTPAPDQCLASCGPRATPTSIPAPRLCAADCNRDGIVTVDEIIRSLNVALGRAPLSSCMASDGNGDRAVSIDDLVNGVSGAVTGCLD